MLLGLEGGQRVAISYFQHLCFLFSKSGLKGCVYGQVAGEVWFPQSLEEGGGRPDPPLSLLLWGAVSGYQAL